MLIKRCERCNIEISDTEYDDWHRFIRIKYCPECLAEVQREQKRLSRKRKRAAEKAKRQVEREQELLDAANRVQQLKEKAQELRQERSFIRQVPSLEQELRQELKAAERKNRELDERLMQAYNDYQLLYTKMERLERQLEMVQTNSN